MRLEGKNSESFFVDVEAQGESLDRHGNLLQGEIKNDKEIELNLTVLSPQIGERMAYFFIEI